VETSFEGGQTHLPCSHSRQERGYSYPLERFGLTHLERNIQNYRDDSVAPRQNNMVADLETEASIGEPNDNSIS